MPGKRKAAKFSAALDEYLAHLERQSERRGKPARWAKNVRSLSRLYLIPRWGKWPLAEMSGSPAAVRDWHIQVTKDAGPTTANRCVQTMRACYKHAAKLNRSLPVALPTSAVVMNPEKPSQKALAFEDFPRWRAAWSEIESPVRRAYHLFCLLSGCRAGEAARLRWIDVHDNEQSFTIPNAKAGHDINLPFSEEPRSNLWQRPSKRSPHSSKMQRSVLSDSSMILRAPRANRWRRRRRNRAMRS